MYKEFKAIIDQGVPVSMPTSTIVCVTSTLTCKPHSADPDQPTVA